MSIFGAVHRFSKIMSNTVSTVRNLRREGDAVGGQTHEIRRHYSRDWSEKMLKILNVEVETNGHPEKNPPALYIGNHVSYVDIPLLMSVAPVVFVAKSQIKKWPIFGDACDSVGIVWVQRDSIDSRRATLQGIVSSVRDKKQSVVVFPSGTTAVDESKAWRWGVFQIAQLHGIPIVPFRLTYRPLRQTAYIDNDFFVSHLIQLLRQPKIVAHLDFHEPVYVQDPGKECERWWKWTQELHQAKHGG